MLRWYSTVIDSHDVIAQTRWWAEALGWSIVHESADEAAIMPPHLSEDAIRASRWEHVPPGIVFVAVPEAKTTKNRVHIDLAPHTTDDRAAEIERLLALGATRVDVGQPDSAGFDVLADPEGNEFCVLSARDL